MGFISETRISCKCLFQVFTCLLLLRGNDGKEDIKIYRGKLDIFTNLHYEAEKDKRNPCSSYEAQCESQSNCEFCRCLDGRNTFMTGEYLKMDHGKCLSDDDIVPESGILYLLNMFFGWSFYSDVCLFKGGGH